MDSWRARYCGAVVVVLLAIGLRPVIVKIRRRRNIPRAGTIQIISDPDDAKFEIVAVHGLGADPEHTWSHPAPREQQEQQRQGDPAQHRSRIHLLRDLLCKDFPDARILSFAHDSRWLTDAPIKTTEEIGKSLLEEIQARRSPRHLPIIFIAHSLGGIVVKQALCRIDAQAIIGDTCGIIFLGTPHQGSPVSIAGALLALATRFLGSDPTLLLSLRSHETQLSNLYERFQSKLKRPPQEKPLSIWAFYETKPTYLLNWLSLGQVVSRQSAVLHASEQVAIDTDHSGLNKCAGFDDQLYTKLRLAIIESKAPSLLEQADTLLQKEYCSASRLNIVRLSGKELRMDQCYINLALVERIEKDSAEGEEEEKQIAVPSRHSLFSRQKVETPSKAFQVELPTIFDQREARDKHPIEPRRIIIRGRAGVGKTTLCKKIVHDFYTNKSVNCLWKKLFDRVLWVQLRSLKQLREAEHSLEDMFYREYFYSQGNDRGRILAKELWNELCRTESGRTLFILDGLDEVTHELARDDYMSRFLKDLLRQPNVIITSRPHASLPVSVDTIDLELETIGFYPNQVKAYLEADPDIKESANEIQAFLKGHWLMQGLMRIPIQLDALSYTWEEFKVGPVPDTMTRIYSAIEVKLWKKDTVRLGRLSEENAKEADAFEVVQSIQAERDLIECLAFNGLCSDVIDFTSSHRSKVGSRFPRLSTLAEALNQVSFLRASDSLRQKDRTYHFIHLTFQEYFAARYFARHWNEKKPFEYLFSNQQNLPSDTSNFLQRHKYPAARYSARHRDAQAPPEYLFNDKENPPSDTCEFLQRHKYSARYDVFWPFVAGLLDIKYPSVNDFFDE